jgi:hypothetical protein
MSKTQTILKDKVKSAPDVTEAAACPPCKAAAEQNTLWRIYVHHNSFFTDMARTHDSYKVVGDALQQFAGFTPAHIQSIFTSIALLPSEMHLIYSGNENTAIQIQNALNQAGLQNSIEATLKRF